MAVRYTYEIRWRDWSGNAYWVTSKGDDREAVLAATRAQAVEMGWTVRRWWQWWRWGENR